MHLIGWLSLRCLVVFFSGALKCSVIWAIFFLSRHTCYIIRGGVLGVQQGGAAHIAALWCCTWGRGPRGNNGTSSALCRFSITPSTTYNQTGPFWCWFPGGWVCLCSRTLWVSLTTSPVSLGVSYTAVSTPTRVFNQRFEALFPLAVWQSPSTAALPTPVHQLPPCCESSLPSCPSPPLLPVWMFL